MFIPVDHAARAAGCIVGQHLIIPMHTLHAEDDDDGTVLVQLENPSDSLSTLTAREQGNLADCKLLPGVLGWVSCRLVPAAAASPIDAARIIDTLRSLEITLTGDGVPADGTAPRAAAAASQAQPRRRRAFKRVGRGKRLFIAGRGLRQAGTDATVTNPPPECAGGSCPQMWGADRIGVPALWAALAGRLPLPAVTKPMTIVDTGADIMHNNVKPQMNEATSMTFANAAQRSSTSEGGRAGLSSHGTHVFGTAAAAWGGGDPSGIAGVMGPTGGTVVSCNTFGDNGDVNGASVADIVRCLAHARQNNAHWVVNLSLGGEWDKSGATTALMRDALNEICAAGGLVIVAAHNYGIDVDLPNAFKAVYPAAFAGDEVPCLLAVAATDRVDRLAEFSNFGTKVRVAAPGVNINSSVNSFNGAEPWAAKTMSGTSMASPLVAGLASLLVNLYPALPAATVLGCLVNTALQPVRMTYFSWDPNATLGGGIVDAVAAYECAAAAAGQPTPPGPSCAAQQVPGCVRASSGEARRACALACCAVCMRVQALLQVVVDTMLVCTPAYAALPRTPT